MTKNKRDLPKGVDVLPSGRYRLRRRINSEVYVDSDSSLEELMHRFEERQREFSEGRRASLASYTVEKFFCKWMDSVVENTIKISTLRCKESMFYVHVNPVFGKRYMDEISTLEINDFLKKKVESGLKESSVLMLRSFLNTMFNAAVAMRVVTTNPVVSVKLTKEASDSYLLSETPHEPEVSSAAIDAEELAQVLQVMSSSEYFRFLKFVALTGLRGGECAALRKSRLKEDRLIIDATLSRLYSRKYDVMCNSLRTTKTRSGNRILILDDVAKSILQEQLRENEVNSAKYDWQPCNVLVGDKEPTAVMTVIDDFIFRKSKTGEPYILANVDSILKNSISSYNRKTGSSLPVITVHVLRHTFATLARTSNVNPEMLQRVLGHSDFSTTNETYLNYKPETVHEAVKGFVSELASVTKGKTE